MPDGLDAITDILRDNHHHPRRYARTRFRFSQQAMDTFRAHAAPAPKPMFGLPPDPYAALIAIPVVVDETFTPGLWRLERGDVTLRAGVVRAEQ